MEVRGVRTPIATPPASHVPRYERPAAPGRERAGSSSATAVRTSPTATKRLMRTSSSWGWVPNRQSTAPAAREPGRLPAARMATVRTSTVPCRRCVRDPTTFASAATTSAVPTACVGRRPRTRMRSGVMRVPAPMPVRPTANPTTRPIVTVSKGICYPLKDCNPLGSQEKPFKPAPVSRSAPGAA